MSYLINSSEILQTIEMINQQHLDVRTITMGINLLDCAHEDMSTLCDRIYDKICRSAGKLVETGCAIDIHCTLGYPPVSNDAALLEKLRERLNVVEVAPTYITEDFSQYQTRVPGVFFWLGTGGVGLHDPVFDFDEAVLETGLSLFRSLL